MSSVSGEWNDVNKFNTLITYQTNILTLIWSHCPIVSMYDVNDKDSFYRRGQSKLGIFI